MKQDYISNQVIRYIYRELPALEHLETEYAIETESAYAEVYERLNGAKNLIPNIRFYPSRKSVKSILAYSRQMA
jgi:hypothetical protein